jgi:uncharacterized membrane protein
MNPEPEPKEPKTRSRPTALWFIGMPVMILGMVSTCMFVVRQFKERGLGHTYYEMIVPGVLLAVIGFVLLLLGRRRTPPI